MNDNEKTKERLICELEELRQRIHELEPVDIEQTHKETDSAEINSPLFAEISSPFHSHDFAQTA